MINKSDLYTLVKNITPPFIFDGFKKSSFYPRLKFWAGKFLKNDGYTPVWSKISAGILKDREIFICPDGVWREMLTGEYDRFFVDFLKKLDLRGKTVYDVGAHIGYSSLCFAELVGKDGLVAAFEPNIYNLERFKKILERNGDLADRIKIFDYAVSSQSGQEEFIFSDNIDNGTSSGSFIDSAHTFYEKDIYEKNIGFKRLNVKTVPIDALAEIGLGGKPDLIKIDIEGAEYLALEGAKKILAKHKPILLIEIHSIFNMWKASEILGELGYKMELLKEEKDGRCFIAAV